MQAPSAVAPGAPATASTTQTQLTPSQAQPKPIPRLGELEDLLYDLLDSGQADPNLGQDKLDQIQAFLHEHARERKTHPQFVEFFESQELPMQPDRPNELILPRAAGRDPTLDVPLSLELEEPAPAVPRPSSPAAVSSSAGGRGSWVWVVAFAIVCSVLSLGVVSLMTLREELARLNLQVAHSQELLTQLQTETAQLRALVDDSNRAVQRTGRDAELLLRTLTAPTQASSK